jgi:hypothetical protein
VLNTDDVPCKLPHARLLPHTSKHAFAQKIAGGGICMPVLESVSNKQQGLGDNATLASWAGVPTWTRLAGVASRPFASAGAIPRSTQLHQQRPFGFSPDAGANATGCEEGAL